jgi:DNA-binding CsgD family transcriptional regulator
MAVSDEPWPLAIAGSIAQVEDPFEALEPLLDSGLVQWAPAETVAPVSIRYPLYRDVIYRSLPAARREVLHRLAASFALGTTVWAHKIAAARTAEPTLAAMLEQEARRYYLAGDSERAGTLLMWSAAMTADQTERQRHLVQGARWWLALRAVDWGPRIESCLSESPPSAPRSMLMGLLAEADGRYSQAHALLGEAADLARSDDSGRELLADIDLASALVHADMGDADAEYQLASGVLALDDQPAAQRGWAEYLAADACGRMGGPEAALQKLADLVPDPVIDGEAGEEAQAGSQSVRLWARGSWRLRAGRLREGNADLTRMLRAGDRATVDSVTPLAHAYRAYARYLLGDWKAAEQVIAQAVAALGGHAIARLRIPVHAVAACVDAAVGRSESATRHVQAAQRWYADCGPEDFAVFPAIAAATAAQARGDYRRMVAALTALLVDPGKSGSHPWWWQPLHVEALLGTGQLGAAQRALDRLIALVGEDGRQSATVTWLEVWLAASRHDENKVRTRFEAAATRPPAPNDIPLHRARLEHEYGRHLMSGRNRRAAIGQLRRAYELYSALGARPFAERCAGDLEACGVRESASAGSHVGSAPLPVLSARERRVAHLAAQGLTNQEIAGELYISAKTVEYHLGNVFAKLGISSRRQIAARLGSEPDA